jgi:hypothetical protein
MIEQSLEGDGGSKVESPKRLRDSVADVMREFDVVITSQIGPRTILTAIECKDWKQPVDLPEVERFVTKCGNVGINKAVMVSPTGFSEGARKLATSEFIQCLDLEQAEAFPWLLTRQFRYMERRHIHTGCVVRFDADPDDDPTRYRLFNDNGEELTEKVINQSVLAKIKEIPFEEPFNVEREVLWKFDTSKLVARRDDGVEAPVRVAAVRVRYTFIDEAIEMDLMNYTEQATGEALTSVATASIDQAGFRGRVAIVYDPEKGGHIMLSRTSDAESD